MGIGQRARVVAIGVLGLLAVGLAGGAVIGAGFLALAHAVEEDSDRGGPSSLLTGTPPDSVVEDATEQRRLLEDVSGVASVEVRYGRATTDIDQLFPASGHWEWSFLAHVDPGFGADGLSELRDVAGASDVRVRYDGTGSRVRPTRAASRRRRSGTAPSSGQAPPSETSDPAGSGVPSAPCAPRR